MRRSRILALAALALVATRPTFAQNDGLAERMRALAGAVEDYTRKRPFFPQRGDWAWMPTLAGPGGRTEVGVWRFPAAQTDSALTGPVCESFVPPGEIMVIGSVSEALQMHGAWKRVPGNRFVPRGAPAGSPVFVQWRREDDRWVIDAFGDTRRWVDPAAPPPPPRGLTVLRDDRPGAPFRPPFAEGTNVAEGVPWYLSKRLLRSRMGGLYVTYGPPRPLKEGDVVRYGEIEGVPVFVEPRELRVRYRPPVIVYVLVSRDGVVQPYELTAFPPDCN